MVRGCNLIFGVRDHQAVSDLHDADVRERETQKLGTGGRLQLSLFEKAIIGRVISLWFPSLVPWVVAGSWSIWTCHAPHPEKGQPEVLVLIKSFLVASKNPHPNEPQFTCCVAL